MSTVLKPTLIVIERSCFFLNNIEVVEHNCLSEVACMWKGLNQEGFEPNTFEHGRIKTASQGFDNSGVQLLVIIVKGGF